jgi:hypothetical protein
MMIRNKIPINILPLPWQSGPAGTVTMTFVVLAPSFSRIFFSFQWQSGPATVTMTFIVFVSSFSHAH